MNDNPLDRVPAYNRVSIRAVLVHEGEDPAAALAEAGLVNAVALPVVLGEDAYLPSGILGNGITPNLTAVLETERGDTSGVPSSGVPLFGDRDARQPDLPNVRPPGPATAMLPDAFGMRPLAPVWMNRRTAR